MKGSSMKDDKATLKIDHQRCAHKIRQFVDERNEPAKLTSAQRHQQS
ncbi:unnamed protein product [Musa textilis]